MDKSLKIKHHRPILNHKRCRLKQCRPDSADVASPTSSNEMNHLNYMTKVYKTMSILNFHYL